MPSPSLPHTHTLGSPSPWVMAPEHEQVTSRPPGATSLRARLLSAWYLRGEGRGAEMATPEWGHLFCLSPSPLPPCPSLCSCAQQNSLVWCQLGGIQHYNVVLHTLLWYEQYGLVSELCGMPLIAMAQPSTDDPSALNLIVQSFR